MAGTPEEMYLEILARLPVKSIHVCKCVCKSWFQIISNPSFVKMHLDINTQRNNYNLIFGNYEESSRCSIMNYTSYDSLWSESGSESEIVEMVDYPFNECIISRFIASCNGLVCMWYRTILEIFILFLNPATKEYKRILSRHNYGTNSGFGYDSKTDDYKLIILYESHGTEILDVYRLGTHEWKSTSRTIPYTFAGKYDIGILVNGALHWFGKAREENSSKLIISLDISNEKFDVLQLSNELMQKNCPPMNVEVLEGFLGVVIMEPHICKFWMMQEYGVRESWKLCYLISHGSITRHSRLISSFKNGQILLWNFCCLVIYDPKLLSFRNPEILSSLCLTDATSYGESLVSVNSGTYARRIKMKGTRKKQLVKNNNNQN